MSATFSPVRNIRSLVIYLKNNVYKTVSDLFQSVKCPNIYLKSDLIKTPQTSLL